MKKGKQVLAIIGIILLVLLYLATLICAIMDNSGTMRLFFASVVATVIIPALIWTYTFIYRLIRQGKEPETGPDGESSSQEKQNHRKN